MSLKQNIKNHLDQKNTKPKYLCYTLDLEEDHAGLLFNSYEGLKYLEDFIQIINERKIKLSFFVQAKLIEKFPEKIEMLRENRFDIHLHSYSHSLRRPKRLTEIRKEIEKSKEIYQEFFKDIPKGYRFPLGVLNEKEYQILKELDFKFDSSVFPSLRLRFFNNLNKPLIPYEVAGIIEIPFSVISKTIRIPIALSYIKLFYPLHFLRSYCHSPLIFDFHMHDLFNLKSTKRITSLKKLHYMRKSKFGLDIFLKFHQKLIKEGYKSISIYEIYNKTKNNQL